MEVRKLSLDEAKEKVIKYANQFYSGEDCEVNDAEYDGLLKLVKSFEPDFDIYKYVKVYEGSSVKHQITYRDFEKTNDISSFDTEDKFNEYKSKYTVLPKFDGSSVIAYYNQDGSLNMILSRSDDEVGFVQTEKLKNYFPAVALNTKAILAEALVALEDGGRSKANGLINSKYCQEDVDKYLRPRIFDYVMNDGSRHPNIGYEITDYDTFKYIRDNGEIKLDGKVYPCDGIVGYPRDLNNQVIDIHKLYYTSSEISEVTNIQWQIAETGIIHPVAEFNPVELDGTMVSRASMSTYSNIRWQFHMYPGCKVKVIKANMTIPKIIEVINEIDTEKESAYYKSLVCERCGSPLIPYNGDWDNCTDLICSSDHCTFWVPLVLKRLAGISGYDVNSEQLDEQLYSLRKYSKSLITRALYSPESMNSFENKFDVHLDTIGIPRLSTKTRNKLIDLYKSVDSTDNKSALDNMNYVMSNFSTDMQYAYYEQFMKVYNYIKTTYLS